jgi:hypothetical protein
MEYRVSLEALGQCISRFQIAPTIKALEEERVHRDVIIKSRL